MCSIISTCVWQRFKDSCLAEEQQGVRLVLNQGCYLGTFHTHGVVTQFTGSRTIERNLSMLRGYI